MLKAVGIERLSGRFLRDRVGILSRPLSDICNLSIISHRVFPDAFEVAKLKPTYKKGKKTNVSNYRPFSLLPVISKVIERIVHDQTNKLSQRIIFCIISILDSDQITQQICVWHI